MNHYEILEVSQNASPEVIKAAYKSLMQRYHPDRNPGNEGAAAHSVAVAQAYDVLSDPLRRATYDRELRSQSETVDLVSARARNVLARASLDDTESATRWWVWLPLGILAVALLWFILSPSEKKPSTDAGASELGALLNAYQSDASQGKAVDRMIPEAARTIPAFMKDVSVNVDAPVQPGSAPLSAAKYVLSIQTIGVVAGDFDPDKFMSFMETNKEYISQKLTEKLADAKYDMLIKHNGDVYLKQFILRSLGEITGTNQPEGSSISAADGHSHYGAVDILLPDSFSVIAQQPDPAAVP